MQKTKEISKKCSARVMRFCAENHDTDTWRPEIRPRRYSWL